jgi:hypothetical protein
MLYKDGKIKPYFFIPKYQHHTNVIIAVLSFDQGLWERFEITFYHQRFNFKPDIILRNDFLIFAKKYKIKPIDNSNFLNCETRALYAKLLLRGL